MLRREVRSESRVVGRQRPADNLLDRACVQIYARSELRHLARNLLGMRQDVRASPEELEERLGEKLGIGVIIF